MRDAPAVRAALWGAAKVLETTPKEAKNGWVTAQQAIRTHHRLLRDLSETFGVSGPKRRAAQQRVLRSEEGRQACVLRALAKRKKYATWDQVTSLANSIRPWADCGEPIYGVPQERKDGKVRWTICYGIKRLSLSYLCAGVLEAVWGPSPCEFNRKGRGADLAIHTLMASMEHGQEWQFTGDVFDFYPSFRQGGLKDYLQLPDAVIRNSVLIPEGAKIILPYELPMEAYRSTLARIRQGLPPGSPVSNLIGSRVMRDVMEDISHLHCVGNYADNVLGTGEDKSEADATLTALEARLAAHPLGPFKLKDKAVRLSDNGIEWLAYYVKTIPDTDKYLARAFPTASGTYRFLRRLKDDLAFNPEAGDLDDAALASARRWADSRASWKPSPSRLSMLYDRALSVAREVKALRAS